MGERSPRIRCILMLIHQLEKLKKNAFLFEQLVKRDFSQKYKRTALGMGWSVLSPLLTLLVMRLVFTQFFGRNTPHYTTFLFCGTLVMSFYREATTNGMTSLLTNAGIISKINVPKYLFLLSKNVSAVVNFLLTLVVFFVFCIIDSIQFTPKIILLVFPIICLTVMNIGVGMILSALYVFFRDMTYLYGIFLMLLNYLSGIFYQVDRFSPSVQRLFLLNPVYVYIKYFREIVIEANIPSLQYHALCIFYSLFFFLIGCYMYKKNNQQFIYYL